MLFKYARIIAFLVPCTLLSCASDDRPPDEIPVVDQRQVDPSESTAGAKSWGFSHVDEINATRQDNIEINVMYYDAHMDESRLIVSIQSDGRIAWRVSDDFGGIFNAYKMPKGEDREGCFAAALTKDEQAALFSRMKEVVSGEIFSGSVVPGADFIIIECVLPSGRALKMSSSHPLFEYSGSLVQTADAVEVLGARSIDEVILDQPDWYRSFRYQWDQMINAIEEVMPNNTAATPCK